MAASFGHAGIVGLLLENIGVAEPIILTAYVCSTSRATPTTVHDAAFKGRYDIVKVFLEKGADVNAANSGGGTLLHMAATLENDAVVLLLIENGADLNAADSEGDTSLHWTVTSYRRGDIHLLQKVGADMNVRNENGMTPLNKAIYTGNESLTRLLIIPGADSNVAEFEGMFLLHYATNENVILVLLEGGVRILGRWIRREITYNIGRLASVCSIY